MFRPTLSLSLSFLLISSFAFGQTAKTDAAGKPQSSSTATTSPASPSASQAPKAPPADTPGEVPESGAVITLKGLCQGTTGPATGADCNTVITREQFEKMVNTLNPEMPQNNRQILAEQYAKALVLRQIAERQGIPESQHYKDMMQYVQTQVMASELLTREREKAKPSSAEVDEYYKQHQQNYEQAAFKRLFIPKANPSLKEGAKQPTEGELKAEADKMRARAVAGEDFDTLEKEAYATSGIKTPPPPTSIPNWRRNMVPAAQAFIFDMKVGEVSQPIVQPEGIYIYKVESKAPVPLNEVRATIEATLQGEKLRASLESVTNAVKPELNESYFGPRPNTLPASRPLPPAAPQTNK